MKIIDLVSSQISYEPETIKELYFGISDIEVQKIQVMWILKHTRAAYEDMYVFENVVLILNGINPDTEKLEGTTPEQIWKAINILKTIHPNLELSHEIKMYIKYIFNDYGLWFYPKNIGLINNIIDQVEELSINGPFPLEENYLGIQTYNYLKIKEYLSRGEN